MAEENLVDRAFLNTVHTQGFTVSDGAGGLLDLTGLVVKWSMAILDPTTGEFDELSPDLQKSSTVGGDMTRVNDVGGEIDVNFVPADTAALTAGDYYFQLEVFDAGGLNGVVVAAGTMPWAKNITETI